MIKPSTRSFRAFRHTVSALLLIGMVAAMPVVPARAQSLDGSWEGELNDGKSWPTFVRLDVAPDSHAAQLTVLGQNIDLGTVKGNALEATIGEGADRQLFRARTYGRELRGTLVGGGANLGFTLHPIPLVRHGNRVDGWNADLDAIRDRVLRYDRSFSAQERREVLDEMARLRRQLPTLSDDAVRVRLARLLATAHNAHTRLYLLRNRTELGRLPIRVWWFGQELRVVRAAPGFGDLAGCRVSALNGVPILQAYARVRTMYAGAPTWQRYMSQYTLTSPSVLKGNGIGTDAARARVTFTDCARHGTRLLTQLPFERSEKAVESWWDLAPQSPSRLSGWTHVLDGRPLPAYLSNLSRSYWADVDRGDGIAYVQLNRAANDSSESVADFATRVAQEAAKRPLRAIVFDLRFNTGGDSNVTKVLVDKVVAAAHDIPIYVITGRSTFSAGIVAVAQFAQAASVRIVGEPVGDGLDFWAEGGNIILPYSGLAAHFANGAHSLSRAKCPTREFCNDLSVGSVQPALPASTSWQDYRRGVDPSLRAVEDDLARRSSARSASRR